mmetsp:Transcript_11219/g.24678  ORF Transcript_11219/g.24678 Transcript_11219/m.24678 type:complete len:94 (-) Transcript_11219:26-307(-)
MNNPDGQVEATILKKALDVGFTTFFILMHVAKQIDNVRETEEEATTASDNEQADHNEILKDMEEFDRTLADDANTKKICSPVVEEMIQNDTYE